MTNIRRSCTTLIAVGALALGSACHRKAGDESQEKTTSRPGAATSPTVSEASPETANAVDVTKPDMEATDDAQTASGAGLSLGEAAITRRTDTQDRPGMGNDMNMPPSSNESGTSMSGTTSSSDTTTDSMSGTTYNGTNTGSGTVPGTSSNDGTNKTTKSKTTSKKKTSTDTGTAGAPSYQNQDRSGTPSSNPGTSSSPSSGKSMTPGSSTELKH